MAESSGPLSGTTLGRYRVGPLLGRGGMGEVYRAEDVELRRAVALKVLPAELVSDADRLARFVQEARTASALNHPHAVSIYEIGEAQGSGAAARPVHYIAMELVQGETLRAAIERRRFDLRKTLEHFTQAAEALTAAHAAGVVHRDLKPDNIMIADGGYVKVLDFGLAKLRAEPPLAGATMTATAGTTPGVVMGTVGYMSPEQAQGLPVDHRSDIFSFGCVLYEAVSGSRPFSGSSAVDTLHKIIHEEPRPASGASVPFEVQRIIRKCLAKSPDERYQSIKDVAIDLRNARRDLESGSASVVTVPASAAGSAKARNLWIALAAAASIAVVALAVTLWKRGSTQAPAAQVSIERITSSGTVIDAVISADGKYITYVESNAGRQSLWLRQVSGTRPIQLHETDGGYWGIALSPDATSVYFAIKSGSTTLGTLYSIPVLGGTARALLSGIDSGVTFSPDGSQVAYFRVEPDQGGASSLMIARADGGDPRPLVTKRPPEFFAPTFFTAPAWSPDGERIAGAVKHSGTRDAAVFTFDVNGGTERQLSGRFSEAAFTAWLPDGAGVVFAARTFGAAGTGNGGQLWLQPYPSGDARRITTDVVEYRNASITADGRSLLTVGFEASARLSIVSLDNGEERRLPSERSDGGAGLGWAGPRLFFTRAQPRHLQIWSMDTSGGNAREVVGDVRPHIAVSRDGRMLAYSVERDRNVQLWISNADGSDARPIAAVNEAWWLTFSPDGRTVFFTSTIDGPPSTYGVPAAGGQPRLVARGLTRAAVSRDGTRLAGIYAASVAEPLALGILSVAEGAVVHRYEGFAPATAAGGIAWTMDGKGILYTTSERMNVWKRPIDGGEPQQLTKFNDLAIVRLALSPDGKSVLLCRGSALRDAFLLTNFR